VPAQTTDGLPDLFAGNWESFQGTVFSLGKAELNGPVTALARCLWGSCAAAACSDLSGS